MVDGITLKLQPDFAWVMAVCVAIWITNMTLGGFVGPARKKYRVKYPDMYATRGDYIVDGKFDEKAYKAEGQAFNAIQRGHQNFLETHADFYILLILAGLFYPLSAAKCGVVWIVGRILYAVGYRMSPNARVVGSAFFLPATLYQIYLVYLGATTLYNSK